MGAGDRVSDRHEGLVYLAFVFESVVEDQHPDLPALQSR